MGHFNKSQASLSLSLVGHFDYILITFAKAAGVLHTISSPTTW